MRRAITLILVLSALGFGLGAWADLSQQKTAREYLSAAAALRTLVEDGRLEKAAEDEAYVHALWQHDAKWLNCLISHHHTRAVSTALLELSTALAQGWRDEALRALDRLEDALGDIEGSDFLTLENVL